MKNWGSDTWVIMVLLMLVFYELTLYALVVFLKDELKHAAEGKQIILFIVGVVSGWLGKKQINKYQDK